MCKTARIGATHSGWCHLEMHIVEFWGGNGFNINAVVNLANGLFQQHEIDLVIQSSSVQVDPNFATVDASNLLNVQQQIRTQYVGAAGGIVVACVNSFTNSPPTTCGWGGWAGFDSVANVGYAFLSPTCTGWGLGHEVGHALQLNHVCDASVAVGSAGSCGTIHDTSLMHPTLRPVTTNCILPANQVHIARKSALLLPGRG